MPKSVSNISNITFVLPNAILGGIILILIYTQSLPISMLLMHYDLPLGVCDSLFMFNNVKQWRDLGTSCTRKRFKITING